MKITICVLTLFLGVCVFGFSEQSKQKTSMQKLHLSDLITGDAVVIGLLSIPIGTVADLQCEFDPGRSDDATKSEAGNIRVITVNGIGLPHKNQPIFPMDQVHVFSKTPKSDIYKMKRFRCRAFEGVQTSGMPNDAFDKKRPVAVAGPWGYYAILNISELSQR